MSQAKEAESISKMKRVKSDNSLQPRHGSSASEEWQAVPSDHQSRHGSSNAQPSSATQSPSQNPRQDQSAAGRHSQVAESRLRDPGAVLSGEKAASQQLPAREGNVDAGNVMGMPVNAAQWRSKGGFIGRPRARVSVYSS